MMDVYKNEMYSCKERAVDLVSRMTLEEKISQLGNLGAAIPRLGIPFYNYWSEASHGYFGPFKYRPMDVTSFPVCLAMSQSWDVEKVHKVAEAISDECRAYYNEDGDELHMWCPTVNMARDPRNGRSDENFGEDPYLTGKLATAYIRGMQGNDTKYIKTIATPKHYALNSSENNRHNGSSNADEGTIREYYTKPFEYAVREGKAESIMTSYNRINGVPASCNEFLLTHLLREEWGFDGMVVSDCGAVSDVYGNATINADGKTVKGHLYAKNMKEASAMTLVAGCDMSCGAEHKYNLLQAMEDGMIGKDEIDQALIRIFTSRFRLGLFDGPEHNPYHALDRSCICSEEKRALSVDMANDTIVLLKNEKKLLPLDKKSVKKVLVVGPNAIYRELGGYSAGSISKVVETNVNIMVLDGIRNLLKETDAEVLYEKGWCNGREWKDSAMELLPGAELGGNSGENGEMDMEAIMSGVADVLGPDVDFEKIGIAFMSPDKYKPEDPDYREDNEVLFARAVDQAKEADYVIVVAGTDVTTAAEEHDRDTLELPYGQDEKIQRLLEVNPNTIVILTALGAVSGKFIEQSHTLLNAHFAGQAQGMAIANVLFGEVNPNAKLTATWYKDVAVLPHINDYGIRPSDTLDGKGRTYMYHTEAPLFPFGYGLSYTTYEYSDLSIEKMQVDANDRLRICVNVKNIGNMAGAEIVQLYVAKVISEGTSENKPKSQLKAFEKVWLSPGEKKMVNFEFPVSDIRFWSNRKKRMEVECGAYEIQIGRNSKEIVLKKEIRIGGQWTPKLSALSAKSNSSILSPGGKAKITAIAVLEDTSRLSKSECAITYRSKTPQIIKVFEDGTVYAEHPGVTSVEVRAFYQGTEKRTEVPFAVTNKE